jgi:hypothetical protein
VSRVNVDGKVWSDPRFEVLATLAGFANRYEAVGRMARIWYYCTESGTESVSPHILGAILGLDPDQVGEVLERAELGRIAGERIRIRGCSGRTDWLAKRRAAAKAGGEANRRRLIRSQKGAKRKPKGSQPQPNGEPTASQQGALLAPCSRSGKGVYCSDSQSSSYDTQRTQGEGQENPRGGELEQAEELASDSEQATHPSASQLPLSSELAPTGEQTTSKRAKTPPPTGTPSPPSKRPLPFTVADLLGAVGDGSKGRVLVELFEAEPKRWVRGLTRVVRELDAIGASVAEVRAACAQIAEWKQPRDLVWLCRSGELASLVRSHRDKRAARRAGPRSVAEIYGARGPT